MKKTFFLLFFLVINYLFAQPIPATITFIDESTFDGFADINENNEIEFRLNLEDDFDLLNSLDITRVEFKNEPYNLYQYITLKNKTKLLKVISEGEITAYELDIFSYSTKKTFEQLTKEEHKRRGIPYNNSSTNYNGTGSYSASIAGGFTFKKIKYYLKKNNNPVEDIKSSFKKKAKIYFENCPGLLKKIKSNEYNYYNMGTIVTYYNDFCTEL